MGQTIAIINQKGGVAKSTTAHALAAGLSLKGYKVLAIDLDHQTNFTTTAANSTKGKTILDVLEKEATAAEAVQHTKYFDFIPANHALANEEKNHQENRLKNALESVKQSYDFIILDTPPALGALTINAMVASDSIIIPAQADIYSIQGITLLAEALEPVKEYCNPGLKIAGILLTMYNGRSVISKDLTEVIEGMAKKLNTKVFKAKIREAVAIKEAQAERKSIFEHAPKANVTKDYERFIDELLETVKA